MSEKIYLTFPFGDSIESVVPLEDPSERGCVVYRTPGAICTATGQEEGIDWHRTIELARERHLYNIQRRIDSCLKDLGNLTRILTEASAPNPATAAKRTEGKE
jgi:hypothetical protein